MATILPVSGINKFPNQIPVLATPGNASAITPSTIEGISAMKMLGTCIGVMNAGASEITLSLLPIQNDITVPVLVKVASGSTFRGDFAFNAVLVPNSVGHTNATTFYLGY